MLCTHAIFKNIRNPLIFLRKMAPYLCFWRVKRSKKHVFRWFFQKTCFFCACLHIFLTGETLTSGELTFHLHQVSLHQIPGRKVLPRLLLLLFPHPMRKLIMLRRNEKVCRSLHFHFPNGYENDRCVEYIKLDEEGNKIEVLLNASDEEIKVKGLQAAGRTCPDRENGSSASRYRGNPGD